MRTVVVVVTAAVLTVKVALVELARTVTLVGTTAKRLLLLASETTAPPPAAAARKVTVPVEETPSATLLGFKVTEETALETTRNKVWVTVVPFREAEITTLVVVVTGAVLAVKVALV